MSKLNRAMAVIASSKNARRLKRSAWLVSAAVAAITLANPARAQVASTALPTGGTVVAGSASIGTPTPSSSLTINQASDRAVINWTSFDIGSAASVTFVQPSSTSIAVNRVTGGGAPSEIAGQLNANGRVAILNPNGVLFSGTADVNVGSLIASTGDIDTNAFMAGGNLDITGATGGEIVVNGNINITAGNLGLAAFVAPTVRNSGVITATAGRVQLGGGTAFTLDLAGDGLLSIGVPASSALVQNNGQIFAEGGRIQMSAKSAGAAVDNLVNTGTLSVDSATLDNGVIVLEAVGGTANLSGTVAANDRNSISQNILISSDRGVNISGNLSGASGTVNITAPHIYGTGKISTATALKLNLSNNGSDTRSQGNFINDALGVIGTTGFGTTIKLGAGIYSSGVRIDASDVTIDGQGVAQIGWTPGIENAIDIWGDWVTVKNLDIAGPATSGYTSFAWGSTNSRGIFVNRYADGVQLLNNNIHDIRTGIIVDGRNVNTYLLGNTIDNTKSAISIQYTDGSNVVMTGNHGSTYGNEWGINLYLNGILQADGVTILPAAGSLGANTPLAEQQRLLALRAANGGMEVQNQGYSALNRTAVYVGPAGSNSNQGSQLGKLATIQAGVNAVVTGGTVYVADGNYNLGSSQLVINHALSLVGASQAGVVIDGRAVSANGLGTISVIADNVSLSGFTLLGSQLAGGNYGIKVAPNPAGHVSTAGGTSERVSNFAVSNVTVSGSRRAELDLNGVVGATITNFTADGQGTDGAGIQITDSANVTLSGVHTLGNNWGGVALYQSNSASGYNAQTTNINIDAGQNQFDEANGLFTQLTSATQGFGTLNLTGFDYAIRNTGSRSDASQFVWFQSSLSNATAFALGLGAPTTSSIEGYTGTGFSNVFTVVAGMGVDAAVRDARSGATINVGAGTYTFSNTLMIDKSLSLVGASESGTIFDASALGVYGMRVHADDVSLSGFTLLAPSAVSSSTYGIKVEVGAGDVNGNARIDDFAISNVTISGSRKTGLDLNSVVGATLDNVNVTGALAGNGISITDSANILVRNTTTSGNAWGGLALYQANGATGSNQQLAGITIEGNNSFGESNGLYLQDSSAINDPGTLSIAGFDYIVRNTAFRSDGSQFTFFRTSLSDATGYALSLGTPSSSSVEGWSGSAGTNQFSVVSGLSIGAALRDARANATVNVGAGTYNENVIVNRTGISLIGAGRDLTTINGISGVGALGAVTLASGSSNTLLSGFTINGIENGNPGSETAAVYIQQTNTGSQIRDNRILAAGDLGLVSEWGYAITGLVVDGNIIGGKTYVGAAPATGDQFAVPNVSRQLVALGGGGVGGGISFTNNVVNGDSGLNMGVTIDAAGSTITGNSFATTTGGTAASLRVRGAGSTISGNSFDTRNLGATADALFITSPVLGAGGDFAGLVAANTVIGNGVWADASTSGDHTLTANIGKALAEAATGTTVHMLDGTYVLSGQLALTRSVSLVGQSQAGVVLDGRSVSNGGGLGTILVAADNSTLANFTLLGSTLSGGNYGIKVQPNPLTYAPSQRINNITISDVTVRGSRRAELDVNGANGVTITNFTADGAGTDGAGVQITDSANVTLSGVHTLGNNWGGVALYQTNRAGGYDGQTTNININAAQNQFEEANGLFAQLESTTQGFGQLNLTGYGYAVRNTGSRADGNQFTYFRTTLADATGWALGLGAPSTSSIEGYTGTAFSNAFTVVNGLSIAAAARDVRANGTINVGAGTYASGTVLIANGVSLLGSTGAKIDASHDGDNGITINADGVTVSGFEIFGPADQSYVTYAWPTITRGIVVANGADNVTVTGNTITGVRNGILIDGRNASTALTNNVIDNTKSAISVQYTSGANLSISGNSEGTFGNEWGIIAYLNGIWNGTTITASAGSLGANTPLMEQQRLLALSAANGGMAVYNQGYSAANRTRAYVSTAGVAGAQGSQRTLLNLQGGLDAVVAGGTVHIGAGTYAESVSLNALRALDFAGPITVNSLSFGAGAAGTNIATNLTATGALSFAAAPVLTGNTVLTGDTISLGAITSAYGLTLNGANGVSIGAANLASLTATGSNIQTAGVITTGAQSYTGNVTLNGEYRTQSGFTVTGLATLAGDSLVGSSGGIALGGVTGAHDFTVLGTAITLGQVTGLSSLSATAATISTAGASTTGNQRYAGATTLNGAYSTDGALFVVDGVTVLGGNVSVSTNGMVANFTGTVSGAHDLAVDAGSGNVFFGGAVGGLTSLSAAGAAISTLGVATHGNQRYVGATTLAGAYTTDGGSLTVQGTSSLAASTSIVTNGGAATLGAVNTSSGSLGNSDLIVNTGTGQATLGTAFVRTLSVTGATIVTAGAGTNATQTYNGATTLNGAYNASSFTVNGATTLGGNTSITSNNAVLGSVGGTGALNVSGLSTVTLGAVSGIASLSASGLIINTVGVTTTGSQSYNGMVRLNGVYSGSGFTAGSAQVIADSSVNTNGGLASFETATGAGNLTVNAGAGEVRFRSISGLASVFATGNTISLLGSATTSGAQTYNGATTLAGTYAAGGTFTINGTATTTDSTLVTTSGGDARFGAIAGSGTLAINAGSGSVTLGALSNFAISATGATILTNGGNTGGAQTYNGATTLVGSYSTGNTVQGSAFTVNGTTTLGGNTSVTTRGNAVFGAINATGSDLAVNALGNGSLTLGAVSGVGALSVTGTSSVTLGALTGLGSASVTGSNIVTAGATTSGAQTYTGTTTLGGTYSAGGNFTVTGSSNLAGATNVTSGGNARFAAVVGTGSLGVTANGSVTLGSVNNIASLSATGATIALVNVRTTGAQTYTGATSLNGVYNAGGDFTVNGAATFGGNTGITAGGNASFGTIGGTGGVGVTATNGNITLGTVTGLNSLSVRGASIVTNGATTSGAQMYMGAISLNGAYATNGGVFTAVGAATLAGNSSVATNGGNVTLGTVSATGTGNGLTVNAGTGNVTLGAVTGLGALNATGATITTAGATTSGAQSYAGATTLNGTYDAGGAFTVAGATTLGGDTSVTAAGNASFGTIAGARALSVAASNVTLGAVGGLTSLTASGTSILTSGASTSGAQSYTGATSLNGSYDASSFTVGGATTLAGDTNVTATGDASFGTIGGAHALSVGAGNVTLGAVTGLTALSATGATIATSGAATSGAQSYTGATSLNGAYGTGGGAFTVSGAATTVNAVSVSTGGGNASFGTVGGAGGLSVNAGTGSVTLGAVSGIASLSATGASIATSGAATSGAQSYTGATSLNGAYSTAGGTFTVTGAATTVNAVSVATSGGNASFGTVGGAGGLSVNAGSGNVTLGAVSGIASLSATGASIATSGAATSGAQSYTGATTLNGSYAGSSFTVNGATTLGASSSILTTGGNVTLGTVGGAGGLTVNASTGNVSLGAVTGLTSLSATGATIATAGATTGGAQSYTGATSLSGTYATGSGGFTVNGATNLTGNTLVSTVGGAITLGAVDAAVAGSQGLTLNTATGSVTLGNLGATRRLGATTVNSGTTVLSGATYAANSLGFTGGTGATLRLTQGTTTFNTSLPGGTGGAITILPDLVGTVNGQQNVVFTAGNGLTVNSGDVTIGNAGTDAIRLGAMSVTGHNFSGATVKLAGNFTSVLSGSQAFTSNTLDTLGSVNMTVAGNESGPIRAGGSVTIDAGGSGSGSIIAGGPVNAQYDGGVSRAITSSGNVTIASLGAIGGSVNAGGAVILQTTTGAITSAVTTTGSVTASSTSGAIGGTITAGGPVAITTTTGGVTSNVTTPGTASITSQSGTIDAIVSANGGVSASTNGAIGGSYTSSNAITLTSSRPVDVQVNGNVVTVTAPSGTVTGVFNEIHTTNTGTLMVNDQPVIGSGTTDARQIIIDTFIAPTRGTVSANGEIQLPAGLALGLIAPAGNGQGGQRPPVVVNNVQRLGELLREGYTAIIIQLDESNLDVEEEVAAQ